jgi:hypothetical protein
MALGLPISDIVNVTVTLSPPALAVRNFGSLLILGPSNVIDTTQRLRQYSTITQVATDFGTTAPEYYAANLFFSQAPQPSILYIGRWAQTATSARLVGGALSATQQAALLTTLQAMSSGGMTVSVNGTPVNATGLNFTAITNLNGAASIIQGALTGTTVTWNSTYGQFTVQTTSTGATATLGFATPPGSGTDLSAPLQLTAATGATVVNGIAAETAITAVQTLANLSNDWYGLMFAPTSPTDINDATYEAIAGYIEAANPSRIFGVTSNSAAILNSATTTDIASVLQSLGYNRTFLFYASSNNYACASAFGRAFTVDFTGVNTTITLKFKQEPGVIAETLTESQSQAVAAKNCNVYVNYSNTSALTAIIQEGKMCGGWFFDERHGLDWLQNAVQVNIFNVLYTSPTKVPQTDPGVNLLVTAATAACEQGVTNGLFAPGVWQSNLEFGTLKANGTLTKGYYVYAQPVALQSAGDRALRKAPLIQVAGKLAGAVHFSNVALLVNR